MAETKQKTKVKQTVNVRVNVGQAPTKAVRKRRRRPTTKEPPMVHNRIIREPTMYQEDSKKKEEEQGRLKAHQDLFTKQEALLKRFEEQQPKQHMVETAQQEPAMKIGKKRGRPKGSPNKPKIYATPVKNDDEIDRSINAGLIPMIMRDDGIN